MADGSGRDEQDDERPVSNPEPDLTGLSGGNGGVDITNMVQACAEEYQNLDQTLEDIDSWMNKMEQDNDSLSSQLDELLESSRQVRKDLQQQSVEDQALCTSMQSDLQLQDEQDRITCTTQQQDIQHGETTCADLQKDVNQTLNQDRRTSKEDGDECNKTNKS